MEYVKSLFLADGSLGSLEQREHGRKLIQLFGHDIAESVNPADIIPKLIANDVIGQHDAETVLNICHTKNTFHGVVCLLHKIQLRLRPEEWYYRFLIALFETDYKHVCDRLEPGFSSCPEMFRPKTSKYLKPFASSTLRQKQK